MRTAEDIVREYRERGYDTFRLRAIAALRPEPMRSQILAILDAEAPAEDAEADTDFDSDETPSSVIADMTVENPEDAPVDAQVDAQAGFQAVTEDPCEEVRTAPGAVPQDSATYDEADEADTAPTQDALDTSLDELVGHQQPSDLASASATMPDSEGDAAPIDHEAGLAQDAEGDVGAANDQSSAALVPAEELAAAEQSLKERLADAAARQDANEDADTEAPAQEDEEGTQLGPRLVRPEDTHMSEEDTTLLADPGAKIRYLYDDEDKSAYEPAAHGQAHFSEGSASDEDEDWYDYGSGLIRFPAELAAQHEAYAQALKHEAQASQEPEASDADTHGPDFVTLDELVALTAPQEEVGSGEKPPSSSAPDHDTEEPAHGAAPLCAPAATAHPAHAKPTPRTVAEVADEVVELENALRGLEESIARKQQEIDRLAGLIAQKDELLSLQDQQLEEVRALVSQRDARIVELEAATTRLHELTREVLSLRVEKQEIERERNVLKTETVPDLEEQQLAVLEVLEEEAGDHDKTRARLHRSMRRSVLSYSAAAVAACFCVVLSGALLIMEPSPHQDTGFSGAPMALVPDEEPAQDAQLATLSDRNQGLKSENELLRAAYRDSQQQWRVREAALRRRLRDREEALDLRYRRLAADLNAQMHQEQSRMQDEYLVLHHGADEADAPAQPTPAEHQASPPAQPREQAHAVRAVDRAADTPTDQAVTRYTVRRGDTLSEIVHRHYGTTRRGRLTRLVASVNRLPNRHQLQVGQVLVLPTTEDMPRTGPLASL